MFNRFRELFLEDSQRSIACELNAALETKSRGWRNKSRSHQNKTLIKPGQMALHTSQHVNLLLQTFVPKSSVFNSAVIVQVAVTWEPKLDFRDCKSTDDSSRFHFLEVNWRQSFSELNFCMPSLNQVKLDKCKSFSKWIKSFVERKSIRPRRHEQGFFLLFVDFIFSLNLPVVHKFFVWFHGAWLGYSLKRHVVSCLSNE